uniref:Uncharacterized protein n=1 Tax=Zeugodacus cucurbitae TaxID=28588 RepID=A0A0A1WTJ3_ZEUCU
MIIVPTWEQSFEIFSAVKIYLTECNIGPGSTEIYKITDNPFYTHKTPTLTVTPEKTRRNKRYLIECPIIKQKLPTPQQSERLHSIEVYILIDLIESRRFRAQPVNFNYPQHLRVNEFVAKVANAQK